MGGAPLDGAGGVGDAGGSRSRRGIDASVTQVPTGAHARGWWSVEVCVHKTSFVSAVSEYDDVVSKF